MSEFTTDLSALHTPMSTSPLDAAVRAILDYIQSQEDSPFISINVFDNPTFQEKSLFSDIPQEFKVAVLDAASDARIQGDKLLSRSIGSMVGMAIADSLGHYFEFENVQDDVFDQSPHIEYPCEGYPGGKVRNYPYGDDSVVGQFMLRQGQWTDDASMALCIADSLLTRNVYDGSNIRIWFWNWFNNGLNNAFRNDRERAEKYAGFFGSSLSVGLGGNIAKSLSASEMTVGCIPTPRFEAPGEDAGNGSLMRLAPIPLHFHRNIAEAREMAAESSLTTHPGRLAAEACALMAHIIVRALSRDSSDQTVAGAAASGVTDSAPESAASFLDAVCKEYEDLIESSPKPMHAAKEEILRLLRYHEPDSSTERCWNWKAIRLEIKRTIANRGASYNGYPVSPGYFGAFSIDGLAMALHCFYRTNSFNEAIVRVINFCGDSDTTGSICAQMAGAYYGIEEIDEEWIRRLNRWDEREIELRAILLCMARR